LCSVQKSQKHARRSVTYRLPYDEGKAHARPFEEAGDRLFIAQDKLVALETIVTRVTAPFERAFGFTLLAAQTIQTLNRFPLGFQGGGAI
jgi:hypothetical protein